MILHACFSCINTYNSYHVVIVLLYSVGTGDATAPPII